MVEETLLSDLCSICNTAKSKYRCPGCAARTCSLPCYKRHQQWAECTGKRDPTKFVKRSQLATPAGIDHDFNFLSGIERDLERSAKDVDERGLGAASDLRSGKPRQGGEAAGRHYSAAGVTVIRAPLGLSRQKENKTHRSKKGHIVWTVEWIGEDKTRLLTQTTSAIPIADSQPFYKPRKRKRSTEIASASKAIDLHNAAATTIPGEAQSQEVQAQAEKQKHSAPRQPDGDSRERNDEYQGATSMEGPPPACPAVDGPNAESVPAGYSFYLLRPRTSTNRHVLIPISSSNTLGECLNGRTVLEYPTIYAFSGKKPMPPEEFMLEEDYLKQEGEEQKELDELMKNVDPEILRRLKQEGEDERPGKEVDSKKILDVLKQDLGTGV